MGFGGFFKGLGRGLLKAAPIIGGVAAAPFTGGASLIPTIAGIAGSAAPVLGGITEGRAKGREAEAYQLMNQDRIRGELSRQSLENQNARMRQILRAQALGGVSDAQLPGFGGREAKHMTGGLRPSALAGAVPDANRLREYASQHLTDELTPSAMPQANAFDKILGVASPAASILGSLPFGQGQSGPAQIPPQYDQSPIPPPPQGLSQGLLEETPPDQFLNPNLGKKLRFG